MVEINSLDDYRSVEVIGLQPDDRLPNDYLRMVARVFAAYREMPLSSAVVAYLDGFEIRAIDNTANNTYDFEINAGSAFVDDQFIGFKEDFMIQTSQDLYTLNQEYSIVLYYEWINITPPKVPEIKFITYTGPESLDSEHMMELGRFSVSATGEFVMHPQDLNALYLKNFVKLFSSVEQSILENIDAFKFQHIIIPDSSLADDVVSGDFVYFDWAEALYKKSRACTKKFDKAVGLYLKNISSGSNYLVFSGIITIDDTKYQIDESHLQLINLEAGATYYLEDGCTETSDVIEYQSYAYVSEFPTTGVYGEYYVDLSTDIIYNWDIPTVDYVESTPQPTLYQSRGKITTRFYPSMARVGFAINHNTLNISMDYSSELNVMNLMELFGSSELFAGHYDSYKDYFRVLTDYYNYSRTLDDNVVTILDLNNNITDAGGLQDQKDSKTGTITALTDSYNAAAPTYAVTDTLNQTDIGSALVNYSKTIADEILFERIANLGNHYSNSVINSLQSGEIALKEFNTTIATLDSGDISFTNVVFYAVTLNQHLDDAVTDSFGEILDINNDLNLSNALVSTLWSDIIETSDVKQALQEYDAPTMSNLFTRLTTWWNQFQNYINYLQNIQGSATFIEDIQKVKEELMYINAPRTDVLLDATYDSLIQSLGEIEKNYYLMWKHGQMLIDIIEQIIYPFMIAAKFDQPLNNDKADAQVLSAAQQATIQEFIDERVLFEDNTLNKYMLMRIAEAELEFIDEMLAKTLREIQYWTDTNSHISSNTLTTLVIEKSALEQEAGPEDSLGVIARIESEKPIGSIFYLSNFQRIQYNYTYLTIRIRTKYSIMDNVQSNIDLITDMLEELNNQVIPDQNAVVTLAKLKVSYETVHRQILAELDSMIAEYNTIRTESYGLGPIAPGDRDFSDGIVDVDGDGIPDEASGFSYANPDLACMAISE